jgi:hypothetical protein
MKMMQALMTRILPPAGAAGRSCRQNVFPALIGGLLFLLLWLPPKTVNAQVHSRPDIYSFTAAERCELRNLMVTYLNIGGGTVAFDHQNPPGPLTFQDIHCYEEFFLTWHREYIREMEEWLLTQNGGAKYVPLPEWDPASAIPCEFFNSSCGSCPGNAIATGFANLSNQNPFGYDFSRFLDPLTLCSYTSGTETPPQFGKGPRLGSAIDNFALDLQTEHNSPHVSIGGSMASGTSPAAAIFWLWHGYVDDIYRLYQCECQGDTPKDLYIADDNMDIGNEPNTESATFYLSPDIWVRNSQDVLGGDGRYTQADDPNRHQNPEAGQANYVYVRIRNIGCEATTASDVDLRLYYSKASTGLNWPTNWVNYMQAGVTYGDEIPTSPLSIPALDPGEEYVAELEWFPPDPADFGETTSHFCLLARLESAVDPMAFAETNSVSANTRNNNNIAWKNVTVVNINPFMIAGFTAEVFTFEVIQATDIVEPIKLDFVRVGDFQMDEVFVTADPEIFEKFLTQTQTTSIERVQDPITGQLGFQLFGDNATIEGIQLEAGETLPLQIRFSLTCSKEGGFPCANFGDVNRYDVRQFRQGAFGDEFIGAVAYEMRIGQGMESRCDPLIVDAAIKRPACENDRSGSIELELRGSPPFTYFWSNGNATNANTDLLPGTYGVTVVDAEDCIDTATFVLQDESDLQIAFTTEEAYCGSPNGTIKAEVTGGAPPYEYAWSNQGKEAAITELPFGEYTLTVTDAEGCQRTGSASIGMRMLLGGRTFSNGASGSNAQDGSAFVLATGGFPPYEYEWSTGARTDSVADLAVGEYTVVVTDAQGCIFRSTVVVDMVNDVPKLKTNDNYFSLYPNPAREVLQVQFINWRVRSLDVAISDASGRQVRNMVRPVIDQQLRLEVGDLPEGMYYLTLSDGQMAVTEKFMKVE